MKEPMTWIRHWMTLSPKLLPFADAASETLPLSRLLRLSLFQVSVGMAVVLLNGTLNRVMIVELDIPAALVALMVALPLLFAPLRALLGFKSDHHRSFIGWRRVPYIWFGTLLQFGGLAIMPFALIVLSGDSNGPAWIGPAGAALAFLLVGLGLHTTQTAGLALATDLAPEQTRPRVVALLYVSLLLGMLISSLVFAALLLEFSQVRLIQVIQGAAILTLVLNLVALWKQESLNPALTSPRLPRPAFRDAWAELSGHPHVRRLLVVVGLGTTGFAMQDILLEPFGGQIMGLSVGETTQLTGMLALGTLAALALAAKKLSGGADPIRLAALGVIVGVFAFSAVIFSAPSQSPWLLQLGTCLIGFGGGLFSVGTLIAAMSIGGPSSTGLALGAWGAVQATAAGVAVFFGGFLRDLITDIALSGGLGTALASPATGYVFVYHLEIAVLFITLIAIGRVLARNPRANRPINSFGLVEFPG